jgi:predicted RNA binding protein YcfA (HicA-like mRNA interferase family)
MRSPRPLNAVGTRIASVGSEECMKVGELMRLLEEDDWHLVRTRGSHRQYKNPNKPGTVTVAGKPSLDVPPGTLNAILKQAGLKKAGSGG